VITLLIVSLSILYLIFLLRNHSHFMNMKSNDILKSMIYIGLIYGFLHTFFMDFILWAYLVLRK
jgi:hypothetical protein